jgi:Asp-tRNA(Asn)/Glu-tRNA(Gln) amidotransferase B subunit
LDYQGLPRLEALLSEHLARNAEDAKTFEARPAVRRMTFFFVGKAMENTTGKPSDLIVHTGWCPPVMFVGL